MSTAENTLHPDNPTATYRGYRRQALYALYRLFDGALPSGSTIQPEGNEDLAIYAPSGELSEVIQVKDYSSNLVPSSFKPSFYKRIAPLCEPGSEVQVKIASFGAVGPRFVDAQKGNAKALAQAVDTISGYGLTREQASDVIHHIDFVRVCEEDLQKQLLAALCDTVTGTDPKEALNSLMWWLLTSSEKQKIIDRKLAVDKLGQIGKFTAERGAFHADWYQTVIPLSELCEAVADETTLASEFYRGVSARYAHILRGFDVPRDDMLCQIHDAFNQKSVVVIKGASGQGKTTLAYRYCSDSCSDEFAFVVKSAEDLAHARRVALALTGHAEAIEVPTLVFLDVAPGDLHWLEVVKGLITTPGIRVLVAIREEDWQRSSVSGADFDFGTVDLAFDKFEAERIYETLSHRLEVGSSIDFEEAWAHFGSKGPLMEFVYFLTQTETLRERVESQIRHIQEQVARGERGREELNLIRHIAVANSFEARVQLPLVFQSIDVLSPERTLELFEREYFLRVSDNGKQAESLHPLRSSIIAEKLTDPAIAEWGTVAAHCLPWIADHDIERFLLCAFSRREDAIQNLLESLHDFTPDTWISACGIARALHWLGLRQYVEENAELIDEAMASSGSGWYILLDFDIGFACGEEGFNAFERMPNLNPRLAELSKQYRTRQAPKANAHRLLRSWLGTRQGQLKAPSSAEEHLAKAELHFWIGRLGIDTPLSAAPSLEEWEDALNVVPLGDLGDYVCGMGECNPEWHDERIVAERSQLLERIREPGQFVKYDDSGDALVGHFLIDLNELAFLPRKSSVTDGGDTPSIHAMAIQRVNLLGKIFLGKVRYGAVGYGHRNAIIPSEHDDAEKPGVLAENIHPPWPARFNAIFRGLVELDHRPDSWLQYIERINDARQKVLQALGELREGLLTPKTHAQEGRFAYLDTWKECKAMFDGLGLLPRPAIDEWGFLSEANKDDSSELLTARYTANTRFKGLWKALQEYTRTVENFFTQAKDCHLLIPILRTTSDAHDRTRVLKTAAAIGVSENSLRLSVVNLKDAYRAVQVLQEEISEVTIRLNRERCTPGLDSKERASFAEALDFWLRFVRNPRPAHRNRDVAKRRKRKNSVRRKTRDTMKEVLTPIRTDIRTHLRSIKEHGIAAKVYSESVPWKGDSALWITADVSHPMETLLIPKLTWNALQRSFRRIGFSSVPLCVMDVRWHKIIVVPLVQGRSLRREAWTNFDGAIYNTDDELETQLWRCLPDELPFETCRDLNIDHWAPDARLIFFHDFAGAVADLLNQVGHIADLRRLPEAEIDDEGVPLLQARLNHEGAKTSVMAQRVFDTCARLLEFIECIPEAEQQRRPNLLQCLELLVSLKEALLPTPGFHEKAELTLDHFVDWQNRLMTAFETLGFASMLWTADVYDFPEYDYSQLPQEEDV